MSRKLVWLATLVAAWLLTALAAPAFAQYPGYGAYDTDPYDTRLHDYGPGYSGGFVFDQPEQAYPPPPAYPAYPDVPPPARAPRTSDRLPYADPLDVDPRTGRGADLDGASTSRTAQIIANPTRQGPGTIVIDTGSRHLYLVEKDGKAIQYGIGVGREGFAWKGTATIQRKAEWPSWVPPADMLKRRPDLPRRMEGGIENPLGARALYLFQGKKDTMFRIHGTNEPDTIGKAVSSGCIRMMNADVIDLYQRVPIGTKVVVL